MLITGGTGSFGQAFTRHLLKEGKHDRICIYSRDEYRQAEMAEKFDDDRLRFFIGDVRDATRLFRATRGIKTIVHAAALKRIETGFYNPEEMAKTNVFGAMNVINEAIGREVDRVVYLSSDKAWQPISAYGQSKALAESLFLAANHTSGPVGPRFVVTRYGNVAGSRGSVIPKWREQIAKDLPVKITDPKCTRFWMTIDEAVELVMEAIDTNAPLLIPDLPAYRLGDLAVAMGAKTVTVGLGEFEKLHEGMDDKNTSDVARKMTIRELKKALESV